MVDAGRATRLLRGIAERATKLKAAADAEERGPLWLEGVCYLFVTAIEGCVDVAQHLGASEGWSAPATNGDAVGALGVHDIIDRELAADLRRAVGFRNVLVHQYTEVDEDVVISMLDRLGDFDRFVEQLAAWMSDQPDDGDDDT